MNTSESTGIFCPSISMVAAGVAPAADAASPSLPAAAVLSTAAAASLSLPAAAVLSTAAAASLSLPAAAEVCTAETGDGGTISSPAGVEGTSWFCSIIFSTLEMCLSLTCGVPEKACLHAARNSSAVRQMAKLQPLKAAKD
ncbi:MAG: hypothetical protein SFV17_10045 [Candidatus Obscuribacter sp.]|nr:hypothetical protein [Candidatus Obscuribacter sp.]